MNKVCKILAFLLCCVPLICLSCADSVEAEEGENVVVQERIPMNFSVAGVVSVDVSPMDTRADISGEEKRTLVGEEIGIYVMQDTDYERALQGLPLQSVYRYMNVRGVVQADGSIAMDTQLYYPLHQESKVAVVAYSPYRADMPDDILFSGTPMSVDADQTEVEGMTRSDFLIGVPESGNPFRHASASGGAAAQRTPIQFSHAYSRVFVTIDAPYSEFMSKYRGIYVTMDNTPLQARVNLVSKSIDVLPESSGAVRMLSEMLDGSVPDWGIVFDGDGTGHGSLNDEKADEGVDALAHTRAAVDGDVMTFQTAAIVFPQVANPQMPPQFTIRLRGKDSNSPDKIIVRTDTLGTEFKPGRDVRYSIHLDLADGE